MEQYGDSTYTLNKGSYPENNSYYKPQNPAIEQSVVLPPVYNNINSGYVTNYGPPPPQPPPQPPPPISMGRKIYRIFFKDPLPAKNIFWCGTPDYVQKYMHHTPQPDAYCKNCGQENLIRAPYCKMCGNKFV